MVACGESWSNSARDRPADRDHPAYFEHRTRSRSCATILFLLIHGVPKEDPPNVLQVGAEKVTMRCMSILLQFLRVLRVSTLSRIYISSKINKSRRTGQNESRGRRSKRFKVRTTSARFRYSYTPSQRDRIVRPPHPHSTSPRSYSRLQHWFGSCPSE